MTYKRTKKEYFETCFPLKKITTCRVLLMKNECTSVATTRSIDPAGNYKFKFINRSTRTSCEKYWKLTIKTPERRQCRCSFFIANFEHVSLLVLVFLMLTLRR